MGAFWRGNLANVIRVIPNKGITLMCADMYKVGVLAALPGCDRAFISSIAGGFAGLDSGGQGVTTSGGSEVVLWWRRHLRLETGRWLLRELAVPRRTAAMRAEEARLWRLRRARWQLARLAVPRPTAAEAAAHERRRRLE